jgi:hypothetical protein
MRTGGLMLYLYFTNQSMPANTIKIMSAHLKIFIKQFAMNQYAKVEQNIELPSNIA